MQRVAIGRALVRRPKALLLDEPIGSLDAKLREGMRVELKRLHLENGSTSIYVTHDQVEAMSLADRIVVMNEGVLQQVGTPDRGLPLSRQPLRRPVHRLARDEHLRDHGEGRGRHGQDRDRHARASSCPASCSACWQQKKAGSDLSLGVRPEGVLVSREQQPGYQPVEAHIIQPFGGFDIIDLKVGGKTLRARTTSGYVGKAGDRVWARIDPSQAHFFDTTSGASLGIRLS